MYLDRVSVTELMTFKDCRRAWYWGYRQRLKTKRPEWNLWIGQGIHQCLEAYYKSNRTPSAIAETFYKWFDRSLSDLRRDFPADPGDIEGKAHELAGMMKGMLNNYVDAEPELIPREIVSTEGKIVVDMPDSGEGPWKLVGVVDLVVRRNQELWIVDHKTHASAPDFGGLDLDEQFTGYMYLTYRTIGEIPRGGIYNVLIKSVPAEPSALARGGLSKSKSQPTTYPLYLRAISRLGLNPEDYSGVLEFYKSKGWSPFFVQEWTYRSPSEIENYELWASQVHAEMEWVLDDPGVRIYPSGSIYRCGRCQFARLCKGLACNEDLEPLLLGSFVVEGR